jgi:hypothetical protein
MPIYVKEGGAWIERKAPSTKVGGEWVDVSEGHVKISGEWQRFFRRTTVKLSDITASAYIGLSIYVYRNGVLRVQDFTLNPPLYAPNDEWISYGGTDTVGDGYEARITASSGGFNGIPDPAGTWLPLTSDRQWHAMVSTVAELEIRPVGSELNTASCTLTLNVTPFGF